MFFSLNSWNVPGTVLQAGQVEEVISGSGTPEDWSRLEATLNKRKTEADASLHPRGAAIGYVTYEGAFQFAFCPEISVQPEKDLGPAWQERSCAPWPRAAWGEWQAGQTQLAFETRVRRAQEYIAAGDIYQVNLAQKFATAFSGNPYRLYEHLHRLSPAPGAAFLDFGDRRILSASPELFFQLRRHHAVTQPIKGTRPRSPDPILDRQLAKELTSDAKEQAELIMITDLERNDFGQICEYGSVAVTQLLQLEAYAQVYHLVSRVEGKLRPEMNAVQALRACLPGGSISGAPKKRACEIIRELEPCPRGIYTGVIGYFDFNGDAAFSIAIRTLIQESGTLHYSVGSGITASSMPAREYEETMQKGAGLRLALAAYGGKDRKCL